VIPRVTSGPGFTLALGFGLASRLSRHIVMFLTTITPSHVISLTRRGTVLTMGRDKRSSGCGFVFYLTSFASTRQSKGCTDEVSQSVRTYAPGQWWPGARTKGGSRPCCFETIHSCVIAAFLATRLDLDRRACQAI